MEWIQRNPKSAVALSALIVLCAVVLVWGASRSGTPAAEPATLGTPTATPYAARLTAPSAPTAAAAVANLSQLDSLMAASGVNGDGAAHSLEKHVVELSAGADEGLAAIGWRMPHAEGATGGVAKAPGKTWTLRKIDLGLPPWVGLYTYVGEWRGKLWCTLKVDGKVVTHREAHGPWGSVYCGA